MKLIRYLNKSENSISILLVATMLSMSYPYGFPLCGPLALFFVILKVFTGKFKIRLNFGFFLFLLCVLFYGFGIYQNTEILYAQNKLDIINIMSYFILWTLLSDLKKEDYPILIHNFAKYAVFVSFIVASISLYKFYQLTNGVRIHAFFRGTFYPNGTSLMPDYNMFSLPLIAGLVMDIYLLSKAKIKSNIIYYLISFVFIFSSLIFAGSRRAWVIAILIMIFIIYRAIRSLVIRKVAFSTIKKYFIITITALVFVSIIFNSFNITKDFQRLSQVKKLTHRLETLQLDKIYNSFSPRTERWDYATRMFNESTPFQAFVGQGFDYLTEFSDRFATDTKEDYPHNPLLSALLYSGLIGLILLMSLLGLSFLMAFNYRSKIDIHFTFFYFISFLYISVSSNSIFSITLFMSSLLLLISYPCAQSIGQSPTNSDHPIDSGFVVYDANTEPLNNLC
ncbi:MAG TPA: O-antigen ligase family protein [Desulfosporosinus sp.]|nr:O-antigen ligase family protein [Desulfosporosinus sp.]